MKKEPPVIYYADALTEEFSPAQIEGIHIDEHYDYGDASWWWRARHFLFYRVVALPLAAVFLKVKYGHTIVNRSALKAARGKPFFLFANHTNPIADALIPTFVAFPSQVYVIVHANNVSIPGLGQSTKFLGALPLPENLAATKNFMRALQLRLGAGHAICIYPEAHIWPFYTGIRPFSDASFRYPVQYKTPVFSFTNTYQKRRFRRTPRIVTYVDGPFYADEKKSAKEARAALRNDVYGAMCARAQNNTATLVRYEYRAPAERKGDGMINILFCGNKAVLDGMLSCMLSIFKRTQTKTPFHFYVFTMDVSHLRADYVPVSDAQAAFLQRVAQDYNAQNIVTKVDVTDIYRREFDGSPNEQCYCSPYTLIRLFADEVPDMPDKLLYLDVDLLFNRDITLLYDTDVNGYEYAAARDHYGKYLIHPNFINAGMLLLNLVEIRRTGLFKKSRDLLKVKKLLFADESAIWRCTTRKKMLPQRFNDQKFLWKHTVVRHFSKRLFWLPYPHTANIKQWRVTAVHKRFGYECFDDVLYEYLFLKTAFERGLYAGGGII